MSSHVPSDIPGGLPVLTEVVELAVSRPHDGTVPDPELIMQALRPLLEAHARALVQVLVQEQTRILCDRLPQELELIARQVLAQVLSSESTGS